MNLKKTIIPAIVIIAITVSSYQSGPVLRNNHYPTNKEPLIAQPYTALPIGNIQAQGWLKTMLEIQRDGLTGNIDSVYEVVCGPQNGWLGGIGDGWERGPYWIDGLVPLAYILDDDALKAKAQKWIEWSLKNQREDGYFGPQPLPDDAPKIPGTQQTMREDWWPKMVMLKIMQQYYSATNDERVLTFMDKYFRYQLKTLDKYPLGHWTYWANRRGGDNLAVVYWYYNISGQPYLLQLADIIHEQTYNWTEVFSGNDIRTVNPTPHLHCVNVAQGLKEPIIYYQQHPEKKYLDAVKKGLESLKDVHGFVNGMYGGDERLHGNNPTQGSELCSAVEMMFSFESIIPITGDTYYADYLEKVAYNVLPTQHDDAFTRRQYFQQANQVLVSDDERNFFNDKNGRIVFGVLTGYPCCTANMHQGWPKLVQSLWYATADNGLAAMVYAASEVKAKVANGKEVHITEETNYPFSDQILFTIQSSESVKFPLQLRVPDWCKNPSVKINGKAENVTAEDNMITLNRTWKKADKVELTLPMEIKTSNWYENSVGIERGPLVYALKIGEAWREVKSPEHKDSFYEVHPTTPWNYGLFEQDLEKRNFEVMVNDKVASMPWNLENAPIEITTKAGRIPSWTLYNHSAGPLPSPNWPTRSYEEKESTITLIPYGCTTLRISEFPVLRRME